MPIKLVLPPPQPKQQLFMRDRHKYVIYGGSRGGGKSFAVDEKAILVASKYPGIVQTILRRTFPELRDNHVEPMKKLLKCGIPGKAAATYKGDDKEMIFPNGSRIRFRFCDTEKALGKIQGQETQILYVDEATNIPEEWLKKLYACVRGGDSTWPRRIYLTCNPGGISHSYIKRLMEGHFIDGEDPSEYNFIQASLFDNKILMKNDPTYQKQLEALPPKLREAWLYGRWDVFEGSYFEEFRQSPDIEKCHEAGIETEDAARMHRWTHVIEPFDIPADWNIERSYDFGYGKPFSVAWWAISPDDVAYRILELYGCTKTPNEGIKWSPSQQMEKIAEIEREHPWLKGKRIRGVADPAIWEGSHGISIAEEADKRGIWFEKGNNDRIAGWMQVRERMKFDENGFAKLYFFNNCKAIIRCMPLMMFDEHKVEDLDTTLEDHACLVGETQVLTKDGYRPISALVGTDGYVLSSDGRYHRYHDCMLTRKDAEIYEVVLEDGTTIRGTADHLIQLEDGSWCQIKNLVREVSEVKTIQSSIDV